MGNKPPCTWACPEMLGVSSHHIFLRWCSQELFNPIFVISCIDFARPVLYLTFLIAFLCGMLVIVTPGESHKWLLLPLPHPPRTWCLSPRGYSRVSTETRCLSVLRVSTCSSCHTSCGAGCPTSSWRWTCPGSASARAGWCSAWSPCSSCRCTSRRRTGLPTRMRDTSH